MAYTSHSGNFASRSERTVPVANGIGANVVRLARHLTYALVQQRQREVDRGDCPRPGALWRTHHRQHGARNYADSSDV